MTESNKILTVSYGTFSCTLEGFDDPFGTMRGIAEYFRDLAAEDRYFGAEPPTPDVEMLQNIAQRDVQRRVEARIGESGVALRPADPVEDAELTSAAPTQTETSSETAAPVTPAAAAEPATPQTNDSTVDAGDLSPTAPLAFDDEYLMADEPEDAFTIDTDAPTTSDRPPESIAEKLRRIRAVVSRNIEPTKVADDLLDETADDAPSAFVSPAPKRERALSETIRSISADIADEEDIDDAEWVETVKGAAGTDNGPDDAEAVTENPSLAEADPSDHLEAEAGSRTPDETVTPDAEESELAEAALEDALDDWAEENGPDTLGQGSDAEADSDSDQDFVSGVLAATADVTPQPETKSADADGLNSDAKMSEDSVDDASEDDNEDEAAAALLRPISEPNGDVGRILQETDEKFADDEGIRRRRVISQMRAAVAATKAERVFSKTITPDEHARETQSPYRRDLTKAIETEVAPDTAAPTETQATEKVAEHKPAPLVLVSSQRVDETPKSFPAEPVPDAVDLLSTDSFADFAEKMGAEELPDLLEAAAAYSSFVEGQPHFSRPEIMKRVARIDPALSLSREAGLRSFGMLLRQGKIRKLQRGQFAISDETRFNPAHRIAGE